MRYLGLFAAALFIASTALGAGEVAAAAASGPSFASLLAQQFDTAAIVAICSAIGAVALACSKFLPGYATKANVVVVAASAVGTAIGALGPQAGAIAIVVAAFGALLGYQRSDVRAAAAGPPAA